MTCQSCGAALQPDARFCATCGAAVSTTCASCGASLPTGARFCSSCGAGVGPGAGNDEAELAREPDAASPEPSGRERKIATLVFADLVGFTSLGESHDPELVGALVGRAFERLADEVARYEGTIEKFAGDAILAVFGVPTVHEDDAERGVRAALEMQSAISELSAALRVEGRPELSVRIGVEGGEVLVDLARARGQRDLFVTGDAVNTAARLQQAAAPGTVVVGPTVYAATRDLIEYEELPPAQLKGKALAVAAWRAIAVRTRRGGRRAPLGLESPLVGREEELSLLKETVRRTVADGRPHLVTVLGAAGVGKSRLTWELEKYLDGLPDAFHWRKGRCLAYAQVSYSALADAAKVDAEIRDDDAPASAEAKLVARLEALGGGARERVALEALLAIRPSAGLGRDELFDGWRRWLELVARRAPLVLVLEDLHWADDGLLDFVEHVARWADGRLMVLALARHELLERRPAWGGGLPNAATIVLEPLAPHESAALVDGLVGAALPPALRERVVALADGNPLFAEELIRMFVDRGVLRFADGQWQLAAPVEELEVPGSVQAVLAARLDALPVAEKRLAQNASVVGRIFWDAVVAHLSRQGVPVAADLLRRLRVKELVVPREPSSLAGASEFGFRHVLIRDVAYESLPKRDRAALHLDVARWAEAELADRLDEIIELVASHYLAALRFEEEFATTDDVRLRAIREATYRYARRAGGRASDLHEIAGAARWLDVAVDQAARLALDPRERAALAEEHYLGSFGVATAPRALAVLNEAIALLGSLPDRTRDDDQLIGRLRAAVAFYLFNVDRVDDARNLLSTGLADLESGGPTRARALLLARLGWLLWRGGPLDAAPAILRRALEEARAAGAADVERWALHDLGVALGQLGDNTEGLVLVRQSYDLARAANDRLLLTRCYNNLPSMMLWEGLPWDEIRPILDEGLQWLRRMGDRVNIGWIAQTLGDALCERGELEASTAYLQEALDSSASFGDELKASFQRLSLAYVRHASGDAAAAAEVDRLYEEVEAFHFEPQGEVYTHIWRALRLWPGDPVRAVVGLREIVEPSPIPPTRHDGGRVLARMAFRTRDRDSLSLAVRAVVDVARTATGPMRRLEVQWMEALVAPAAEAVPALVSASDGFLELGERWSAADVLADAAIAAVRAGLEGSAYRDGAQRVYAECGIVPFLGPLPETRWTAPAVGAAASPA